MNTTRQNIFRYSTATLLYSYQDCKCFYCNKFLRFMNFNPENPDRAEGFTIDHLMPKSLGYGLAGNAVLACRKCNEKKNNRLPTIDEVRRANQLYYIMGMEFIAYPDRVEYNSHQANCQN